MSATIFTHLVQRFAGTGAVWVFDGAPEHCPACGQHIQARPLAAHATSADDQLVDFAFQCPRPECRRMFVAEYGMDYAGRYTLFAAAAPAFDAAMPAYADWLR